MSIFIMCSSTFLFYRLLFIFFSCAYEQQIYTKQFKRDENSLIIIKNKIVTFKLEFNEKRVN